VTARSRKIRLIDVVRQPERLRTLQDRDWERILEQAERARLLGRLVADSDQQQAAGNASPWLLDRLASARALSRECERAVAWEVARLSRAFLELPCRWVLLKGAAYVAAGLPPAAGRRVADIDVLVPHDHLDLAEAALKEQGWGFQELSEYDTKYYREWMHELPPMVHEGRGSIIDLHHTILPRTARLHVDAGVLLERAVAAGSAHVLCPTHMVLHGAVHLFHDGEIAGAVRDLVDLDGLLRIFPTAEHDFFDRLTADAIELGLERPLFYALRYSNRLLGTPVPAATWEALAPARPSPPMLSLMDSMVERTLEESRGPVAHLSAFGLYVRSHWLRMPPLLLARHLAHKAIAR